MHNTIHYFTEAISDLSLSDLNDLFDAFNVIQNTDQYFTFRNLEVHAEFTEITADGKKHVIPTLHTRLELERIRKNRILRSCVNRTVKIKGVVDNVRLYPNSGLFCLSPCFINDVDIGHTWTRYLPEFRNIKLGSQVNFYSEIKRYGEYDSKSGINWENISFVHIKGGNNSSLLSIPLTVKDVEYAETYKKDGDVSVPASIEYEREIELRNFILDYTPQEEFSNLRHLEFNDFMQGQHLLRLRCDTLSREIILNSKYSVTPDSDAKIQLDSLLFFEWLAKLRDYEFWYFVRRQ